jgi:uncharacterized phage infection (PIP) family protein YhgE
VVQNGQCVRAPVGTPDPRCNGGQCDKYGGCVTLSGGKKLVGDGAICGDRWCNIEKGENKENCPTECTNAPSGTSVRPRPLPSTTQYPSEQYQRGPGGPPSGEEGSEMGEEDSRQIREKEEQFRRMKQNINQFVKGIDQMQRQVKRMQAKLKQSGVAIPPELMNALAKAPELINKLRAAKTFEEAESLMEDIQDIGQVMQDWGPRLGELEQLGSMLKNINSDVRRMQTAFKRINVQVKKKPILQEPVTELENLLGTMTAMATEAKALAKTDPEAALDKVSEFYANSEEYWNQISYLDMLTNLTKGLSQATNHLKQAERRIKALERRKGINPEMLAELKAILAELKERLPQLKEYLKQRSVDFEELKAAGEDFWDKSVQFENLMAEIGEGTYMPKVKSGQGVNIVVPEGFIR